MEHPFVTNLSAKSMDELAEGITDLNKKLQFMFRLGKHNMVSQIGMAINAYKSEYAKRQQELWDKKSGGTMDDKIDIS